MWKMDIQKRYLSFWMEAEHSAKTSRAQSTIAGWSAEEILSLMD